MVYEHLHLQLRSYFLVLLTVWKHDTNYYKTLSWRDEIIAVQSTRETPADCN